MNALRKLLDARNALQLSIETIERDIQILIENDNRLDKRQKSILIMRFIEHKNLEDVGKKHQLTRERIRQIEAKASMILDIF